MCLSFAAKIFARCGEQLLVSIKWTSRRTGEGSVSWGAFFFLVLGVFAGVAGIGFARLLAGLPDLAVRGLFGEEWALVGIVVLVLTRSH